MALPLPKWLQQRYALLWKKFEDGEFTREQALEVLSSKDRKIANLVLSELRKSGWLTAKFDEKDHRKRVYNLKSPNRAILEMAKKAVLK